MIRSQVLRAAMEFLWFRWKFLMLFVLLLGVGAPLARWGAVYFRQHYEIGVASQSVTCIPWDVYFIVDAPHKMTFHRGDLVYFVGRHMGHGFDGDKVVKFVAGLPGDKIVIRNGKLFINGAYWDKLWLCSFLHRPRTGFDRAQVVPPGKLFVLGTDIHSYDSRYWGFIDASQILGYAFPLL